MNDISQKLADSLELLQKLQESGVVAIQSKQLSRAHRERLLKHEFIREVIRGWYIPTMPDEKSSDSTSWYTSFWGFCGTYFSERFDNAWCLSPEQSIILHIGDRTVPQQLLVRSPEGNNKPTAFLHNTSIFDVRLNMPATEQIANVSIHAPAGGATYIPVTSTFKISVSIHAPAGGATKAVTTMVTRNYVSIHAPAGGATPQLYDDELPVLVSIHAPAGGATNGGQNYGGGNQFQSTRLREARHSNCFDLML